MEYRPIYQDIDTANAGDQAVRLADVFSHDALFFDHGTGRSISLANRDEIFARGAFRAKTIRSHVLYTDCDLKITSSLRVRSFYHPHFCVAMLTGGSWASRVEDKISYAPSSDVPCLITTSEPVEFTTDQTAGQIGRMVGLCIGPDFFDEIENDENNSALRSLTELVEPGVTYREFAKCEPLKQTLRQMYQNPYRGVLRDLYLESLALSAIVDFAGFVSAQSRKTSWTDRVYQEQAVEARRLIDLNLASPPSVAAIATILGVGETTLRRAFKSEFGSTIFEYLRDRRLEAARVMLREKRLRISEIAFRVGYSNPANFANAYKKRFGHAPKLEF